jgi:mycoketide-CoA synthase
MRPATPRSTPGTEPEELPVLAELDKIEAALAAIEQGSDKRFKIMTRLEAIVADFRAGAMDNASDYREIDDASDDQMFELINNELGI